MLAGLVGPAAAQGATKVSGGIVFEGPGTPPASVKLTFSAQGVFPERTVTTTGPGTQYSFNLPTGVYTNVDASFIGEVSPDAFSLPGATALVRELPPALPLLSPREFRADDLVFRQGARLALPITDRAGKRFRPPRGWRSRGGTLSIDFAPEVTLPRNTRTVTGLTDPQRGSVTLALAYRDTFNISREISPPTLMLGLPDSAAGTTVTVPKVRIDASPPTVRRRSMPGRRAVLFLAGDRQSGISLIDSGVFVKSGRRYRALRNDRISVVDAGDRAAKLVPKGRTGILVESRVGSTVRLCVANGQGVQAAFKRCPRAVVGR